MYRTSNWIQNANKVILGISLISSVDLILSVNFKFEGDGFLRSAELMTFVKLVRWDYEPCQITRLYNHIITTFNNTGWGTKILAISLRVIVLLLGNKAFTTNDISYILIRYILKMVWQDKILAKYLDKLFTVFSKGIKKISNLTWMIETSIRLLYSSLIYPKSNSNSDWIKDNARHKVSQVALAFLTDW